MKKFPIDLSCLTEEEISQFQEDPYTLYNGDQNVAIYLRYSSTGQSDQSIEGQLRDCRTFCKANHYRIMAIYVDRATTARKDVEKRVHLMEMISDSAKQNWEYVIVWKLDRFARNRNDSAIMKMRLRKNGVKVLSATEHLTDSPESIILESVLEGMAEFFSAELSQKVTRGMRESALKCHSVGGHIPLGYKVENHKLVVDPDTAHIVQEAFSLYANGESVAAICRKFNSAGYKTAKNTEFNRSSFKAMFRNTRYIGTYTYKDIVIENGIPAIIDKELFETVQRRLSKTATAPARGKAKVDYLLSGKLFCGHCGASMNGESGAGRHGKVYHYYSCYTKKRKLGCDKRPLKKDYIEGIVARDALNLLTDQLIDEIADMAIRQSEQDLINDTHIPQLTAQLSEVEKSITNITAAIEKGIASETLMNRLVQLEHEKKTLNKEIKAEEKFVYRIDRDQIVFWLSQFKYGNIEDENFRRRLIDLLVNSVTVWDEPDGYKITTAYNLTSCKTKTFRVEKNPAAEEATGFDFGESECSEEKGTGNPNSDNGNSWYTICNHGVMTVNAGATVKNKGTFSSVFENGYYSYTKNAEREGYVEGTNNAAPKLTINGGTFEGGKITIKNDDGGILEINNGTFTNAWNRVVYNVNVATINGGSFSCPTTNEIAVDSNKLNETVNKGVMTITGGTFDGKVTQSNGTFTVSGGTFKKGVDESYIVDGKKLDANGNVVPETITIIVPSDGGNTTTTPSTDNTKNPGTGANDFVGVAAAMAVVSLLGAAAVIRKK